MHELSIAVALLDLIEEESERRGGVQVVAVHLKLGPLSGVVKEALLSAYDLAREGSAFQHCELLIREVPLVVYCPACQANRPAESVQQLCCSVCKTPTPQVVSGRELEVAAMEIRNDPANAPG